MVDLSINMINTNGKIRQYQIRIELKIYLVQGQGRFTFYGNKFPKKYIDNVYNRSPGG